MNRYLMWGGWFLCHWFVSTAQAGWEYIAVAKGEGNEQAAQGNMTVKGWVDGPRARIEFQDSSNPMLPSGAYILSTDGGQTMFLVNPEQRSYAKWDLDAMMGVAGGAMQMMGIKFSQPKIEKLADEKGPTLVGMPTRYYRFRTSHTMTMNFMGFRKITETVQDDEVWTTDHLQDKGFLAGVNQNPPKTGHAELDILIAAEFRKIQGFPLKRITTTTQKESDGQTMTTKNMFEVTMLTKKDLPASVFELPQGYTEQPLFPSMMGRQEGNKEVNESSTGSTPNDNPFLKFMQQQMQRESR